MTVAHIPLTHITHTIMLLQGERMIQKSFGLRIKFLREQMNLSQEKFALSIGMDRTYYASVERGKRNISLVNIERIANGLGISLAMLFTNVEEMREGD